MAPPLLNSSEASGESAEPAPPSLPLRFFGASFESSNPGSSRSIFIRSVFSMLKS